MNPATELPLPHRLSTSCNRHPEEKFNGFCPSCLCERLAVLDNFSAGGDSSSRKPPTSGTAAALRAIFKPSGPGGSSSYASIRNKQPSLFVPELRRTKSFSASKNEGSSALFEPQRRSCDVRARNTLWSLFSLNDERNPCRNDSSRRGEIEVESKNLGSGSNHCTVFESKDEGETETETEIELEREDKTGVFDEPNVAESAAIDDRIEEIIEEDEPERETEQGQEGYEELKTMKAHIDLDSNTKKPSGRDFKDIAGSFWTAASVFSKKLQKWRQKQKLKKRGSGTGSPTLPVEKPIGRQYRETQSEIADYGFGRRSCDTGPRFSLDAGRMSLDAGRMSLDAGRMSLDAGRMSLDAGRMSLDAGRMSFDDHQNSFDEPRASWDGYVTGRSTLPRMPTMLSVVEDAPVHVMRSDNQIPVEEPRLSVNEDERVPGGTEQTRDYYSDSSSRWKSLDRSSSLRKNVAAVATEMKSVSNSKVSPTTIDYINVPKLVVPDRGFKLLHSNSLREDCSEPFELGFRDNATVVGNCEAKVNSKKSRRWKAWKIWGFMQRRGGNKDEDDDRMSRSNGVERSFSESWRNGDARGGLNPKIFRSNSSVSWRNSSNFGGTIRGIRNNTESNGHGKKQRDEFVFERNRSARYSPNNIENGLLRFYLTPMRGSRRGGIGKSRPTHTDSIVRTLV